MQNGIGRRKFLQAGGATVVGAFIPSGMAMAVPEVPATSKMPRLMPGCCAYSYDKYLGKGPMTMEDFFRRAVELEVNGVDVTTYYLKSTETEYLLSLRRLAQMHGLPFSGAAIGVQMCQQDPAKRAEQIEEVKKWVDRTDVLGASHLRVFGGYVPHGVSDEQAVAWVVEVMKPACDYAAKKGVVLGIESHGGITSKASNIIAILKSVDSPYAGCNLDISNFAEDQYAQIEALIPYATHTHIRDRFGYTKTKEPVDLERVWRLFAQGGYQGYMSAEYEAPEDPMTGVPKLVAKIKDLCKKYSTL
jgi:sugar phosphate isomerase/epimerase